MTQKKKGRPFKTEAKKDTRIAVKVTKETFRMLKGVKKSDILNDGLAILMPTLGKKWDGEKWIPWEHEGTAANLVAHKAICYAIELQMDIWQRDREDFSFEDAELLQLLRMQKVRLEALSTFKNT
jgi:hypothetical protein